MYIELATNTIVISIDKSIDRRNRDILEKVEGDLREYLQRKNIDKIHIFIDNSLSYIPLGKVKYFISLLMFETKAKKYIHCSNGIILRYLNLNFKNTTVVTLRYTKPVYFRCGDGTYRKFTLGNRCGIAIDDVKRVGD